LLALLAALVIGDQIGIDRPGHKYRLMVEVDTPTGVRSASGVMAVHPDRSYSRGGQIRTVGDAIFVDLGDGRGCGEGAAGGRPVSRRSTPKRRSRGNRAPDSGLRRAGLRPARMWAAGITC